ncbi:hypothetical protein GCM10023238_38110 [Streptomyces heliomycini]
MGPARSPRGTEGRLGAEWLGFSVLTGNIDANARVKLSAFGLDSLLDLPVGAYGADADLRPDLVAVARERVQRLRGVRADTPTVLVGDTPRDVEAALVTRVRDRRCRLRYPRSRGTLRGRRPEVLSDLADTKHLLSVLESFASDGKRPGTSSGRPERGDEVPEQTATIGFPKGSQPKEPK